MIASLVLTPDYMGYQLQQQWPPNRDAVAWKDYQAGWLSRLLDPPHRNQPECVNGYLRT